MLENSESVSHVRTSVSGGMRAHNRYRRRTDIVTYQVVFVVFFIRHTAGGLRERTNRMNGALPGLTRTVSGSDDRIGAAMNWLPNLLLLPTPSSQVADGITLKRIGSLNRFRPAASKTPLE